jgi:hypothetical protein
MLFMDLIYIRPSRRPSITTRAFLAVSLLFFSISGIAQAMQAPALPATVATSPVDTLRPALQQVSAAIGQIQIDHWKLSREWKQQFSNDAASIQQDLNGPLPGLLQTAQENPAATSSQLAVMHNVDALYDVLVRLATAADICGGKSDAAVLDNALRQLESSRKAAAGQILQMASAQDQKVSQLQAQARSVQSSETANGKHVIVVDNRVGHTTRHRKSSASHTKPTTPSTEH